MCNKNISPSSYPANFLWGVATAGHQVEGNNNNADIYLLETVTPSVFREKSALACNHYQMWEQDLDLVVNLGLNCYRFSLEWARIEPQPGEFDSEAIAHYQAIIRGCQQRNLLPVITLCHFSSPIWFSAQGGWTNAQAPQLFARYCREVCRHMGADFSYVITFNEPNILEVLDSVGMPQEVWQIQEQMLIAAAKECHSAKFSTINSMLKSDFASVTQNLIVGHRLARDIVLSANPQAKVGFSLAVIDDIPSGENSMCSAIREKNYGRWLDIADDADFIGVQNYEKVVWDAAGAAAIPDDAQRNASHAWIDATSLRHCVEYIYARTGKPILISEHGVCTEDDTQRQQFLRDSLVDLSQVFTESIPLLGYIHWTLIDNFEWISGFSLRFGLYSFNKQTFIRHAKPSAATYRALIKELSAPSA